MRWTLLNGQSLSVFALFSCNFNKFSENLHFNLFFGQIIYPLLCPWYHIFQVLGKLSYESTPKNRHGIIFRRLLALCWSMHSKIEGGHDTLLRPWKFQMSIAKNLHMTAKKLFLVKSSIFALFSCNIKKISENLHFGPLFDQIRYPLLRPWNDIFQVLGKLTYNPTNIFWGINRRFKTK